MKIANANSTSFNLRRFFGQIMLFFALTPWASWGTNSMDSQPWSIIFSFIYLSFSIRSIFFPKIHMVVLIFSILCVYFAAFVHVDSSARFVRGIVSYLTIPLVLIGSFDYMKRYGIPLPLILSVNALWWIVGILELISPGLVSWTSVARTTAERGVTSLAPEPTFFAVYLIFSSWLILVLTDYQPSFWNKVTIIINIFCIFFLARSAMGIIYLMPLLIGWFIVRFGVFVGALSITVVSLLSLSVMLLLDVFLISAFQGTRIERLFLYSMDVGLMGLVYIDASVNVRIEHAILPIYAFMENSFLPHGFLGYGAVRPELQKMFGGFFWYDRGGDNIMSWTGAILFEAGFLGVIFIFFLFASAFSNSRYRMVELLVLLLFLIGAIPLAFSPIPILLASLRYKERT